MVVVPEYVLADFAHGGVLAEFDERVCFCCRFVEEHLSPSYRRSLSGTDRTWCPSWWKHEEAISRLESLWRAWEFLRLDGSTGMSIWWRDHADHHMGVLLSADGPFKGCKPVAGGHAASKLPLPCDPPPEGLF